MLVPHNLVSALLEVGLEFLETIAESRKDSLHITVLLHWNDSEMVFFVNPNEEVLFVIVPNSSRVGPISGLEIYDFWKSWEITYHTSSGKKSRNRFVKEKVVSNELVLVLFGHGWKTVVLALEFTIELGKSFAGGGFDLSSFGSSAPGRKSVTS